MQIQCTVIFNLCHVNQKNVKDERVYERRYEACGGVNRKNMEGI
jgi:hypothetical protein